MTEVSTISMLGFGFLLGLKHAIEADHMAAVSTMASERSSVLDSSFVGALWGIGHTVSLFGIGAAIVLLNIRLSDRVSLFLELTVGVMLLGLGANALWRLRIGGRVHMHMHRHGGRMHVHPHIHDGADTHTHHVLRFQRRPLIIGMIHGLAGSGALMLLVLSTIHHPLVALLYIFLFGIGSTGGMMLMSALVGLPAMLTAQRFTWANTALRCTAGVLSIVLGSVIIHDTGFRRLLD